MDAAHYIINLSMVVVSSHKTDKKKPLLFAESYLKSEIRNPRVNYGHPQQKRRDNGFSFLRYVDSLSKTQQQQIQIVFTLPSRDSA